MCCELSTRTTMSLVALKSLWYGCTMSTLASVTVMFLQLTELGSICSHHVTTLTSFTDTKPTGSAVRICRITTSQ